MQRFKILEHSLAGDADDYRIIDLLKVSCSCHIQKFINESYFKYPSCCKVIQIENNTESSHFCSEVWN